jgi:lipooligosaccharide transport system permease protein
MNSFVQTLITLPKIGESYRYIWYRNFLQFKRTFMVSLFWVILEPLMYLGAIGFGVGSYINNINGQSYIDFFFPGLLCSTAMMVPFFEGTYANYTKLTYQKLYNHMLLTKMTPQEIVFGEILWATSKGLFGILGLTLIGALFGLVQDFRFLLILFVLVTTSWLFSAIAMLITSYAKNYDSFIYATSGFIIPMSLIAGTYFPINNMRRLRVRRVRASRKRMRGRSTRNAFCMNSRRAKRRATAAWTSLPDVSGIRDRFRACTTPKIRPRNGSMKAMR